MKKKEELPEIKIKLIPRSEKEAEIAYRRLVAIIAGELGWVPKEIANKRNAKDPNEK